MGFGKKNKVDLNPLHYNIGLLGESGVGKTTVIKEVCEKLAPEKDEAPGYIHLDIGREDGSEAIEGINTEKIEDWRKFEAVVSDIVKNRYTDPDYANLQTVIIDTYDELMTLVEPEVVRLHNKENPDKPKITSINAAFGGFGKGQDKAIDIVFDKLWELKKVGVHFIIIAHTKSKDIDDPVTGESYSILTSNISQKYFNAIKTKLHFLGVAYIDRTIVKEKTGKVNIVTKQEMERNIVKDEARVIKFRDDNFSVDSKSRFADIVESIPLDSDMFIKAMQDAIWAESRKGSLSDKENEELQKQRDAASMAQAEKYAIAKAEAEEYTQKSTMYIDYIKSKFTSCEPSVKKAVKTVMAEYNFEKFSDPNIPLEALKKIVDIIAA